jgi:hypothetical protein
MGQGGSSFIFILVYWVWLGVGVRELFSPGNFCDVGFLVDVFINVWEMLFEKKSEVGKILEGRSSNPRASGSDPL